MKSHSDRLQSRPGTGREAIGLALAGLPNLGAVSARALASVGIQTRADLAAAGAIGACERLLAAGHGPSLNMAYAIEGALMGCDWRKLPCEFRQQLARGFRAAQRRALQPREFPAARQ